MKNAKIACFDVYYYKDYTRASGIVFEIVPSERIVSKYCKMMGAASQYISGAFYKRELPCLLGVYKGIKENIDLIIVDGFVFLDGSKKGLGAYFFEALGRKIPVIGVAKTFFRGCGDYTKVYRGSSSKPLYVSSIGIDQNSAAGLIRGLRGGGRIPEILRKVDRLSRNEDMSLPPY